MPDTPLRVTEIEMSVLEALWANPEPLPVRTIVVAVYGRHEHSLHAAVKSFLDRLMEKGFVGVDKSQFAHRFTATISREEFVGKQLREMAESHFQGSVGPLLLALVDQVKLSRKDRAAIEKIIDNIKD